MVLWELLQETGGAIDLDLTDLERIDAAIDATAGATRAPDAKLERLQAILADGRPTIVFVSRRETVRHLRERLGGRPIAWCTGARAGLGYSGVPRSVVLGWFRTGGAPPIGPEPSCLVVTDVAAEGLDLHRAARVVHYDLPWTPMRLEQREGRVVRLGSVHREVEVVRFEPPDLPRNRVCVRALFAAEQLALDEGRRNRRAAHADHPALTARAEVVNRPRHHFLARSRFTEQQDGGGRWRDLSDLRQHPLDGRALHR